MKKELKYCYKGERDYVHGTDIFNSLIKEIDVESVKKIDISFNSVLKNNCDIVFSDDLIDGINYSFLFKYSENEVTKFIYGCENIDKVKCNYEYADKEVSKEFIYNEKVAKIPGLSKYSLIENIVAANKYLLQGLFPEAKGKWYFTRLNIPDQKLFLNLVVDNNLQLEFVKNFNFKLTKTNIIFSDKVIGSIFFSLVD